MRISFLYCTILVFVFLNGCFIESSEKLEVPANLNGKYFGQKTPGTAPEKFAKNFISTTYGIEYSLAMSSDENEVYFTRNDENNLTTIWVTTQVNNIWSVPSIAQFAKTYSNSEPFITNDRKRIYFISYKDGSQGNYQIWFTDRTGIEWSTPQKLSYPLSNNIKSHPSLATNGNLYFAQKENEDRYFIFMAENKNGVLNNPVKLSSAVNALYTNNHPFISPDEKYLLFDGAPVLSLVGSSAIYICIRNVDGSWGNATKLNYNVNATTTENYPSLSPDGKFIFFHRYGDIWWVDFSVVNL